MTSASVAQAKTQFETGVEMRHRIAAYLAFFSALLWAFLLFRWITFGTIAWDPFAAELALAEWPPIIAYLLYGILIMADLATGFGLLREKKWALALGILRNTLVICGSVIFYYLFRDFYGSIIILALAGMMLVLELRASGWALAYPAAFWLAIFFFIPILIVLIVSLGERSRLGTVTYPPLRYHQSGRLF